MARPRKDPTRRAALFRLITKVIELAEHLGEEELADLLVSYKDLLAREAAFERERADLKRRLGRSLLTR